MKRLLAAILLAMALSPMAHAQYYLYDTQTGTSYNATDINGTLFMFGSNPNGTAWDTTLNPYGYMYGGDSNGSYWSGQINPPIDNGWGFDLYDPYLGW